MKREKKSERVSVSDLRDWLQKGETQGYIDATGHIDLSRKEEKQVAWVNEGTLSGFMPGEHMCYADYKEIERRVRFVLTFLSVLVVVISVSLLVASYSTASALTLCLLCGVLGSTTAALMSALNRQALGFEDRHGHAYPDPDKKKERFSIAMSRWFLLRPTLGLFTGAVAYWGVDSGLFGKLAEGREGKLYFAASIAGFFAKTFLDILKRTVKALFKV